MRTEFTKLLKFIRKNTPDADLELLRKAYRFADRAHRGQMRLSGEPYITHCLAAARILAGLELDMTTIAAGLLHDVLEDTAVTHDELLRDFGPTITNIVDSVSKISALPSPGKTIAESQAASIRKMLVATVDDVRVLVVKLADRLHNMRTIEYLPPEKIERISRETMEIYAPLAHRLGIARWKWELEDHAFHRLNPVEYKTIASRVAMKRREREAWLAETIDFLKEQLAEDGIQAEVVGRPKHLHSIYRKMLQQGKDFDEVRDIQALRIITTNAPECYAALGTVHGLWTPISGRFKDYIAMPKANRYQSIHTTVMCEKGVPLEIQIRTEEMDHTAQEGIAAHWRYKEGEMTSDQRTEENLRWLRQMYEWMQEAHNPQDFLEGVRREVQMSEIFVFTPKSEVKELPAGSTPLDFAYAVHSDVGDHCIGARVNGRIVQFSHNLRTGDMVEILTSKNQTPHVDWLDIAITTRARTKIRQRLREMGELEPLETAKAKPAPPRRPAPPKQQVRMVDDATRGKLIRIEGKKDMQVQFAKCCNPMPGHAIVGYTTRHPGITVHRSGCGTFGRANPDPKRVVDVSWASDNQIRAAMRVTTSARSSILADITTAIVPLNITITEAQFKHDDDGRRYFDFVFDAPNRGAVDRVTRMIKTVAGVTDVKTQYIHEVPIASRA